MKYITYLFLAFIMIFTVSSSLLHAQQTGQNTNSLTGQNNTGQTGQNTDCVGICLENPIKAKSITGLIEAIIDIVLVFAVPVIVFFIILAGFKYVTARGDTNQIQEAHMALLYALIGGVLILGAKVLIVVISGTVDAIKG
jgi:hypothetical protein